MKYIRLFVETLEKLDSVKLRVGTRWEGGVEGGGVGGRGVEGVGVGGRIRRLMEAPGG